MTTEAAVDTAALDAWLAEYLDFPCAVILEGAWEGERCEGSWQHHHDATGTYSWSHEYQPPDLTTGDGMLMVLKAMRERGWAALLEDYPSRGYWEVEFHPNYETVDPNARTYTHDSLPTAVALAARAALEAAA